MSVATSQKVIIGLSGGVDSSVAAYILKAAGFQVEGLFMKNWDEDDGTEHCTAMTDFEDALQVAQNLGIECHTASFSKQYWDRVFAHFLEEYRAGRTPNPDILCNKEIKFKAFLEHALKLGADYIATGHYSQIARISGQTRLYKGSDPQKDQSYFLHAVPEQALAKTLFPVGGLLKSEVRRLAEQAGFDNHNKKDSTGICFIGERKFNDFLKTYLPAQPGNIVTDKNVIVGEHQGLMYHTIGQRQGLGIGGLKAFGDEPWYVADKNTSSNELLVVQGSAHPLLFRQALVAHHLEWLNPVLSQRYHKQLTPVNCYAKTRYRQADQACQVAFEGDQVTVVFDHPQRAITPGQSVVFYDGLQCLGGGIIGAKEDAEFTMHSTNRQTADNQHRGYPA